MKPIEKILVPFDGSQHSNEAVACAADLARRYHASLLILYVDHPLTYALPEGYAVVTPEQAASIRAGFERDVASARNAAANGGAIQVDTLVQRGDPATEIVRTAADGPFDLIVMGTHGRSGVKRALLGSVTENVVRQSACPVLTVHA
jgi:nucleotide-binding universal stress UspA family protein